MELTLATLLEKAWILLCAWFWYDKRQVNERLKDIEKKQVVTYREQGVLETKLDGAVTLFKSEIQGVRDNTEEIKRMLNARRSQ